MPFELGGNLFALQLVGTLLVVVALLGWGELAAVPFRWSGPRYLRGPEAIEAYLRRLGYDFRAFTPPTFPGCLYDGSRWEPLASSGFPMWRDWGSRFVDFQSNAQALAGCRRIVFASAEIVVLGLR